MKKTLLVLTFIMALAYSASAQRFGTGGKYEDNTARNLTYASLTGVTLASTDSITPKTFESFYSFSALTAAKTLKGKTTNAKLWDKATLEFTCDTLTAGRIVTFSTGFVTTTSGNTMTVKKSKKALIVFLFDGVAWVEESRSVQF